MGHGVLLILVGLPEARDASPLARALARGMGVSEHTVQDHLKSVFARTGTRSRRDLLARALGG